MATPPGRRLAKQAVVSSVLALLLAIILVGLFDPTIRDDQDLLRVGIRPLGRLPAAADPDTRG